MSTEALSSQPAAAISHVPAANCGRKVFTQDEWLAEGKRLYGPKARHWRFRCPSCKGMQTPKQFLDAKLDPEAAYFNCIGRYLPNVGCDWTLGGLLWIHTVEVMMDGDPKPHPVFEFADTEPVPPPADEVPA